MSGSTLNQNVSPSSQLIPERKRDEMRTTADHSKLTNDSQLSPDKAFQASSERQSKETIARAMAIRHRMAAAKSSSERIV